MHAVIRSYSGAGAKDLFDRLESSKTDVEKELRRVKGLVSYALIRSADGGVSVTICQDKSGTDDSVRIAREWIQKNASDLKANPPTVTEGTVVVQLS